MKHPIDNTIILDLGKVQWSRFGYINGRGTFRHKKPSNPTVRGDDFMPEEICFGAFTENGMPMTMLEFATMNGLLDRWTPMIMFQLTANHNVCYTGDKAISLTKAWNERIFKKK